MKQLNDPIFIILFRGDKSASAANSVKDTQESDAVEQWR